MLRDREIGKTGAEGCVTIINAAADKILNLTLKMQAAVWNVSSCVAAFHQYTEIAFQ